MSRPFEEHVYIGLSEVSTAEKTSENTKTSVKFSDEASKGLNFKATELRLGLPGSESPERVSVHVGENDEYPAKNLVSGAKRGFSDAINGGSNKWGLLHNGGCQATSLKNMNDDKKLQSSPVSDQGSAPLASSKAQVVGWPPIRSFRKNTMATNALKTNDNKDGNKLETAGCHYIKVSMDGAPYLRKIDLKTYGSYVGLSSALEKMFSGFTMGEHGNKDGKGKLIDTLKRSEYVLTYEDKDGDWMLVGDVPWNMFLDSCKRLRIMKSSEAVGLASIASDG